MLSDYLFVLLNKLLVVAKEKCEDLSIGYVLSNSQIFFFLKSHNFIA